MTLAKRRFGGVGSLWGFVECGDGFAGGRGGGFLAQRCRAWARAWNGSGAEVTSGGGCAGGGGHWELGGALREAALLWRTPLRRSAQQAVRILLGERLSDRRPTDQWCRLRGNNRGTCGVSRQPSACSAEARIWAQLGTIIGQRTYIQDQDF